MLFVVVLESEISNEKEMANATQDDNQIAVDYWVVNVSCPLNGAWAEAVVDAMCDVLRGWVKFDKQPECSSEFTP